jgi:hypothetical protein
MSREIDCLVAENVMGWKLKTMEHCEAWIDNQNGWVLKQMWKPSTNIQDAWLVLEKICKDNDWRCIMDVNGKNYTEVSFKSQMGGWRDGFSEKETAPLAICSAALDAVEKAKAYE